MKQITAYRVRAGSLRHGARWTRTYHTAHHAEQLARALRLHGMTVTVDTVRVRLPNDALTALTVQS